MGIDSLIKKYVQAIYTIHGDEQIMGRECLTLESIKDNLKKYIIANDNF